jgi:hypothetical protein
MVLYTMTHHSKTAANIPNQISLETALFFGVLLRLWLGLTVVFLVVFFEFGMAFGCVNKNKNYRIVSCF